MSFFIVPVSADSDYQYLQIPEYSYTAYNHFLTHGYSNLSFKGEGYSTNTYTVNLDNIGTLTSYGSTLGAKYLNCTTNNAVSGTQTYSCYFSDRQNAVSNSQSITIKLNENTDITGSITEKEYDSIRLRLKLPFLIEGNYVKDSSWNWDNSILARDDNPTYMIFYTRSTILNANRTVNFYNYSSSQGTPNYSWDAEIFGHLYLNVIKISANSPTRTVPAFNGITDQEILPVYYGYENSMPDEVAYSIRIRKPIGYYFDKGNNNTSSIVNNATDSKNEVNDKITSFDSLENNSVSNMNTNINNLNLTSDILSNSKFLTSANWVKVQFDRMTVNTPIGSVLSFSLILGISLIFLGKIR